MAKPNYAFAKRQRDLAKKQKKEEKKLRKAGSATEGGDTAVVDDGGVEVAVESDTGQAALAVGDAGVTGSAGESRQQGHA